MTNETKRRIQIYKKALPSMRERIGAALIMLLIAMVVAVMATYAWTTLSYAPEVTSVATTFASNGSLEIALAKADGSEPDEYDIDESVGISSDILVKNLNWGNLVNLSDDRYGLENYALRPAQLNSAALISQPLKSAAYGKDGRATELVFSFAYVVYDGTEFRTPEEGSKGYGVRGIASYTATISDSTQQAREERIRAVDSAHTIVNQTYEGVRAKFSALGTMISKYAQDKLDEKTPGTNLAPYLNNVIECYETVREAMYKQKDAYVALADFQNYMFAQNNGIAFTPTSWEELESHKAAYNVAAADGTSSNGIISLVGLTQFISDLAKLEADIGYLNQYYNDYKTNGTAYYWGEGGVSGHQIANIIANLIDYNTMTIDLKGDGKEVKVVQLSGDNASDLLGANGQSRNVYTYNGILIRFEQNAVDESYRINGKAACTIKVTKILTITVNGKAYTKASGTAYFMSNFAHAQGGVLVPSDIVAEDTYGLAVDLWFRSNAEETMLKLEGAVATDEQGNIYSYDGVNRIWGSTNQAVLTTDSTTQGGGSCYIYYADTPEDMERSLDLLDAMRIAFVDESGNLLAQAGMDTQNYWAAFGRITVPLVLDTDTQTTYTFLNDENEELLGRAITTLKLDVPQRITAIVYIDGTRLQNTNVLSEAEIQGQLNVQFGSTETLLTVGDNDLIDDTRSLSATLSRYEMDYDTATDAEDLTTDVFLSILGEGEEPHSVTAFFIRAINATQGTREQQFTFEKQPNGQWLGSYTFTSPGTYYLRHIRLDGVEYALAEPQRVDVAGFGLRAVTWGEGLATDVTKRTSDNSYSEPISVQFASSDPSRMPRAVHARFVRESDGNVVNVPLSYSSSKQAWTGTASFSTSGVYTLQFLLIYTGNSSTPKYMDLRDQNMTRTLRLALGLYVEVRQGAASLQDQYEPGTTYRKDVTARILDNAGNELTELENAVLYYSNGGSATGTVNTTLVWNEAEGCYDGEFAMVKAGRYRFSSLVIEGNYITRSSESPTYFIISPDPPTFNTMQSACSYYGGTQFAPLTYDAVIDRIVIDNGEAASVTAVVYNPSAVVGSGDNVTQSGFFTLSSERGEVLFDGTSWYVKLPSYTREFDAEGNPRTNASYTQEGTWSLVELEVFDCYDASSEFRSETNPIVWASDSANSAIKGFVDSLEAVDQKLNFDRLSTTVSCTVKVQMSAGITALGSADDPFMSRYPVSSTGMYVLVTDESDRIIPADKISDVKLTVSYQADPNSDAYGYKVQTGANMSYEISLNTQDAEDGHRTVSEVNGAADFDWQYVGVYRVNGLSVKLGSNTLSYSQASNVGIPDQYTVTTAGPSSENISLLDENITQRNTVLGKTGDNVTGTFLQAQNPGVSARITLTTPDNSNTQYVILDNVAMDLVMTYQSGKTAPNGGYSWSGTSAYETVTIPMTNSSGTYSTSAAALLAGVYQVQLRASMGGTQSVKDLKNVSVYSRSPSVTISSVSPTTAFQMNTNREATKYVDAVLVDVQNYRNSAGTLANVYIQAGSKTENVSADTTTDLVHYTLPTVTLTLANAGTAFSSGTVTVPNADDGTRSNTFSFSPSQLSPAGTIGSIQTTQTAATDEGGCDGETFYLNLETQYCAGDQTVSTITMVDAAGGAYSVTLDAPFTIRELSSPPPSISYRSATGYNSFESQESEDGGSFRVTLPTAAQFGTVTKEEAELLNGDGWGSPVSTSTSKYTYVVRGASAKENKVTSGSGCNQTTTTYYYYEYTFHKYTRTQRIYEQTSGTRFYNVTNGLTGWDVGGTVYSPGATITISGNVTATPVIGQVGSRVFLREETVTMVHTTYQDSSDGTTVYAQPKNNYKSADAAAKGTEYASNLPRGYSWYNSSDHSDSSWVTTTETQLGDDYQQ